MISVPRDSVTGPVWALLGALALAVGLTGCGESEPGGPIEGDEHPAEQTNVGSHGEALSLSPRVELHGLTDVFESVQVTHLMFTADLFVLPDDADIDTAGDAVLIRFTLDENGARTELTQRPLRLAESGRYRVLVRVRPASDDAPSVEISGRLNESLEIVRRKAEEPAPSPARGEAPRAEPAPSPARSSQQGDEPAPSPADEPAPSPADEPAPSPADEPAPSPADEGYGEGDLPSNRNMRPVDEPAPSPARQKPEEEGVAAPGVVGDAVIVHTRRSFEFFAGVVTVRPGDHELVVAWDIAGWLRGVLAEPLGIEPPNAPVEVERPASGFEQRNAEFEVYAR